MKLRFYTYLIILFSVVCHPLSAADYYQRHYVILVDQIGSSMSEDPAGLAEIGKMLKNLFLGNDMNNGVDIGKINTTETYLANLKFNPETDEISIFKFGFTADGNRLDDSSYGLSRIRKNISGNADEITVLTNELIKPVCQFHKSGKELSVFLNSYLDPLFKGNGISPGVNLSSIAFPCVLKKVDSKPAASEYYIIIVSNFKTTGALDNRADYGNIRSAMKASEGNTRHAENFSKQLWQLNAPFYTSEIMKIQSLKDKNDRSNQLRHIDAVKALCLQLGVKSLQGVSTYITSNIDLRQKSFQSSNFQIGDVSISFNHNEDVSIDSVKMVVTDFFSKRIIWQCLLSQKDYTRYDNTQSYKFDNREIELSDCSKGDSLTFKYVFYATIKNGSQTIMPMVFVADRNVLLTDEVFYPEYTLFEKMALLFFFIAIIALVAFAWVTYNKRGKKALRGVHVKIWHVSNSRFMELKDYHVVDRECWYMRKGETQRLINITGNVDVQKMSFARPYQLKVEFKIDDVDSNEDFSFRPEGHENNGENRRKAQWYEVPLNSDGSFEINAIVYQVEGSTPDLENMYNILDMKVTVKARLLLNGEDVVQPKEDEQYYHFIVRPEIANAALWMAFDPGTSGACVAYGIGGNPTDQTNIKIAYHTKIDLSGEKQIPIFPSKIKIPDESSIIKEKGQIDIVDMKEAPKYNEKGDFYFGDLAEVHEGRNSFQSIKKLLGYNDMQPLLDENRHEICRIPARDLALLLVKGLCNHFENYIRTSSDVTDKERSLFIQNNEFAPSRAIVAVPNNYTIVKAQDMVDSVKRTGLFKEVHYLYEAEAVMMCYLRNNWDDITIHPDSYAKEGRFFVVFDMGGATINTTAFAINVITAENRNNRYIREIELSTKARVGYNVGGDDIDYAWIRILYQIPAVMEYLENNKLNQEEHIRKHRTGILKFVQKLKLDWMERLSQETPLNDEEMRLLWMSISSDNGLPEFGISLQSKIDEKSAEYIREEWSTRSVMKKYVFTAVENAVTELLSTEHAHSVDLIFSGRTSLYPGIRQTVTDTVATLAKQSDLEGYSVWDGFEKGNTGKSIDEVVKTAVATGACWYAMFSKFITLKHNIVTSTFGYVDMKHGKSTFIPLILRGTKLDDHGKKTSDTNHRILTPNLPNVRILQMLTTKHEEVMKGLSSANTADNDKVKHLVNQLAHLTNDEVDGEIKGIVISVDDKNNFSYQVNVAGGQPLTGSGTVNDADIKTENSDAYAFSAMPCSEDETEDRLTLSDLGQSVSDKPTSSQEVSDEDMYSSNKSKKSNGKKHF